MDDLLVAVLTLEPDEMLDADEENEEQLAAWSWSMQSCSSIKQERSRTLLERTWIEPNISSLSAPTRNVDKSLDEAGAINRLSSISSSSSSSFLSFSFMLAASLI
jgi:hypothetical protein